MIETKGIDLFLEDLKCCCKANKIKLRFAKAESVVIEKDIRSSGYFDSGERTIAIAKKNPGWLSILVHESAHLEQYLEKCEVWETENELGNNIIDAWLLGEEFDRRKLKKALRNIIALELDCEKRSIKKIAEYDLPINHTTYIQKANTYLLYHHRMFEKRSWEQAVYNKPLIASYMPDKFLKDEQYFKLQKKYEKIFINAGV